MSYNIQQQDISILRQKQKEYSIKLELLNFNLQPIDILQGDLVNGNITIDSTSDIRRICNLTFHVKNKSYLVSEISKIWFDKFFRVYIGTKSFRTQETVWYPQGLYVFSDNQYTYDVTTNALSVKCLDLMAKLNSTRNGQIGSLITKIPAETSIRSAMISTLTQLGFIKKYIIADIGIIPYDLKFEVGCSVYDILKKLCDLYAGYEMFFDDDTFVFQKIPTGQNEQIILDESIFESTQLMLSESKANSLERIKNVTEIWGKVIEVDLYSDVCSNTNNQYNVTIPDLTSINDYTIIGVKINASNLNNPTIKFNTITTAYQIVNADNIPISASTLLAGQSYSFKIKGSKAYYLGQWQVHAIVVFVSSMPDDAQKARYKERFNCDNITYVVNPESPFTVERVARSSNTPYSDGVILDVKSEGDYEKIYSNDLASQQGKLDNWKTTRLEDGTTLEMQLVPWLDVNKLVRYKSKITGLINTDIIKNISITLLDGKMQCSTCTYYPLYPDIT